ncbi:MAG: hypothetical protein J2P54_17915 [Bradyrhizobiaceae bacterium]|nr:hypothetical protein [Bradyrhizobiaceae bacterium]
MEAVWGGVLAFLFVLATLSGYGAGLPPEKPKDKSEQSDKKDEDKKDEDKKKNDEKKNDEKKEDSKSGSSKAKPDRKEKGGQNDKGPPASKKRAEFCIKDCPENWRIRQ